MSKSTRLRDEIIGRAKINQKTRIAKATVSAESLTHPLSPNAALLCKLGSIAVHVDEMLSVDGHAYDRVALQQLLADPEVAEWLRQMNAMAMVPRKRK